jgi:hypothetical protein
MDVQEFSKLRVDDVIRNEMSGSNGIVVAVESMGVRVRWGDAALAVPGITPTFFYSVQGTAWFHWSKVAQDDGDTAPGA